MRFDHGIAGIYEPRLPTTALRSGGKVYTAATVLTSQALIDEVILWRGA